MTITKSDFFCQILISKVAKRGTSSSVFGIEKEKYRGFKDMLNLPLIAGSIRKEKAANAQLFFS